MFALFSVVGTNSNLAIRDFSNAAGVPQVFSRRRRDDVRPRLREVPVDDRLPAAVLGGGRDLRAPHPRHEREEGEDRRALPERRLRQGSADRVPQGARREARSRSCRRSATTRRVRRPVAGRAAEGERREHVLHLRVRQVRDPGVRLREQARLEAADLRQRRRVRLVDHEAEPAGHRRRLDLDRVGQGSRRRRSSRAIPASRSRRRSSRSTCRAGIRRTGSSSPAWPRRSRSSTR